MGFPSLARHIVSPQVNLLILDFCSAQAYAQTQCHCHQAVDLQRYLIDKGPTVCEARDEHQVLAAKQRDSVYLRQQAVPGSRGFGSDRCGVREGRRERVEGEQYGLKGRSGVKLCWAAWVDSYRHLGISNLVQ